MDTAIIENNFTYHAPNIASQQKYESLLKNAKHLANLINEYCPESREKSLAFTNLEQAIMWANASIARQGGG